MNSSRIIAVTLLVGIAISVSACAVMTPVPLETRVVPDIHAAPEMRVAADTQAATKMDISIADFAFAPTQVIVKVGATVVWTNHDNTAHTTTSDNGAWDSGNLAPDQSYSHTFTQPGNFTYHCNIHPFMTGSIGVTE